MSQTPRFSMPFILTNQAQKEVTHNEALLSLDGLLHLLVESANVVDPPGAPEEGQAWIVPVGATGAWAGQETTVAQWAGGAWRFHGPAEGMQAWIRDQALPARSEAGAWIVGELRGNAVLVGGEQVVGARAAAIADPAGGTVVDAEARSALSAVLEALRSHGLIAV